MEVKILDEKFVGDKYRLEGINIIYSKSIDTKAGRRYKELIETALEKIKRKKILPIINDVVKYIIVLHENEVDNFDINDFHSYSKGTPYQGLYSPNLKTIALKASPDSEYLIDVIIHEIGHGIHMNYLTPSSRKYFDESYKAIMSAHDKLHNQSSEVIALKSLILKYLEILLYNTMKNGSKDPSSAAKKIKDVTGVTKFKKIEDLCISLSKRYSQPEPVPYPVDYEFAKIAIYGETKLIDLIDNIDVDEIDFPLWFEDMCKEEDSSSLKEVLTSLLKTIKKFKLYELYNLILEKSKEPNITNSSVKGFISSMFPTQYSMKNDLENFAESFLYWVIGSDKLKLFDRYRIQNTIAISKAGGRQVREETFIRQYIKLLLEQNSYTKYKNSL